MKRKKLRSLSAIRRQLDKEFSRYVRLRHADHVGNVACVTCNKSLHWSDTHCGHYVPRQYLSVRWDDRNANVQCPYCNTYRHGNLAEYTLFMQKTYGQSVVDELLQAKHKTVKFTRSQLEEMLLKYQALTATWGILGTWGTPEGIRHD